MQTKFCRYDKILHFLTKFGFSGKNSKASLRFIKLPKDFVSVSWIRTQFHTCRVGFAYVLDHHLLNVVFADSADIDGSNAQQH